MKKQFPDFQTDAEAEDFVATANLNDYDLSDMVPVRFELNRKDKAVSLRLPEQLLEEVKSHAKRAGVPVQRFIRLAIERAISEPQRR
jgi:predicted DNA binding CopG/RHH family protein